MALLTARSSTIFIATGDSTQVYHSVNEIPAPLRRRLKESTQSPNSATILIADRRGRDELVRALQGEPSDVRCRLADSIRARQTKRATLQKQRETRKTARKWLGLLLPIALGASLWFLAETHY